MALLKTALMYSNKSLGEYHMLGAEITESIGKLYIKM